MKTQDVNLDFGINNRITVNLIRRADYLRSRITLIRGHFAIEDSDCQTMGVECACAVAMLFLAYLKPKNPKREFEDSYIAVHIAQTKTQENLYLKGFVHGWDGQSRDLIDDKSGEYDAGYVDGQLCVNEFQWVKGRKPGATFRR